MSDDKPERHKQWRKSWNAPKEERLHNLKKREREELKQKCLDELPKIDENARFKPRKLSETEREFVLDCTFDGSAYKLMIEKLGMTKRQFDACLEIDPEFKKELDNAEIGACRFWVNDLLNAHIICYDAKMATTFSNNRFKLLAANMPEKYGTKIDLNLNQNVSIRIALEGANDRITRIVNTAPLEQLSTPQT